MEAEHGTANTLRAKLENRTKARADLAAFPDERIETVLRSDIQEIRKELARHDRVAMRANRFLGAATAICDELDEVCPAAGACRVGEYRLTGR